MADRPAMGIVRAGRVAVSAVGLAVVLALVLGVATTALVGTGVGAAFNLGHRQLDAQGGQQRGWHDPEPAGWPLYYPARAEGGSAAKGGLPGEGGQPQRRRARRRGLQRLRARERLRGRRGDRRQRRTGPGEHLYEQGRNAHHHGIGGGLRSGTYDKTHGRAGSSPKVDGAQRGRLVTFTDVVTFTDEMDGHRAFVADQVVVKGLPAGTHEIKLDHLWDPN
jgi:hypothetical protein